MLTTNYSLQEMANFSFLKGLVKNGSISVFGSNALSGI